MCGGAQGGMGGMGGIGRSSSPFSNRGSLGGGYPQGKNGTAMMDPSGPQMSQPFSAQSPQTQMPTYGGTNFGNVAGFGMQKPMMEAGKNGAAMLDPNGGQVPQQDPYQANQDAYYKAIGQTPPMQAKGFTPPNTSNPGVTPLNLPPNGGVPAKPTGPMQPGQTDWQWDNQRNSFLPQWNPAARQFILQNAYGSGAPAPWMNKDLMNSEYTDPNFMANIQKLSGNKFGG